MTISYFLIFFRWFDQNQIFFISSLCLIISTLNAHCVHKYLLGKQLDIHYDINRCIYIFHGHLLVLLEIILTFVAIQLESNLMVSLLKLVATSCWIEKRKLACYLELFFFFLFVQELALNHNFMFSIELGLLLHLHNFLNKMTFWKHFKQC